MATVYAAVQLKLDAALAAECDAGSYQGVLKTSNAVQESRRAQVYEYTTQKIKCVCTCAVTQKTQDSTSWQPGVLFCTSVRISGIARPLECRTIQNIYTCQGIAFSAYTQRTYLPRQRANKQHDPLAILCGVGEGCRAVDRPLIDWKQTT